MITEQAIWDHLENLQDAMFGTPLSVVDVGLVHQVKISGREVYITILMFNRGRIQLDAAASPIRQHVLQLDEVDEVMVECRWEVEWTPDRLSPRAREVLGFAPDDPVVRFANAGHLAAIHYRAATDTCEEMDGPGLPLGVDDPNPIAGREARLEPGDVVVLYTDGVTDAFDPDDKAFGTERLETLVRAEHSGSPDEICQAVSREVIAFARGRPQFDDLTLVVLKWPG